MDKIKIELSANKSFVEVYCIGNGESYKEIMRFVGIQTQAMPYIGKSITSTKLSEDHYRIVFERDAFVKVWTSFKDWYSIHSALHFRNYNSHFADMEMTEEDEDIIDSIVAGNNYSDVKLENYISRKDAENEIIKQDLIKFGVALSDETNLESDQYASVKEHLNGSIFNCSLAGCGKTIVSLSSYVLETNWQVPLVVFGSKSAIDSWQIQELPKWVPEIAKNHTVRITSKNMHMFDMLVRNKKVLLINYDIIYKIFNKLSHYFKDLHPYCILDEAHRLKNIASRKTGAMLRLVGAAYKVRIVTATPNPNDVAGGPQKDLITLLMLAHPNAHISQFQDEEYAKNEFSRLTTYSNNLPDEVVMPTYFAEMSDFHKDFYLRHIASKNAIRRIQGFLNSRDLIRASRALAHIMMYIAYPSSPNILARLQRDDDIDVSEIENLRNSGHGAKIDTTVSIARDLLNDGKKVIIWTSWNDTANYLHSFFSDEKAVVYNGSIKDKTIPLEEFHKNPDCRVFVGNIGCGEAISLHRVAQHAIFNDFNYNYCYYVQSRNRHRRRNMPAGTVPTTYFIQATYNGNPEWTVDHDVSERINLKHQNSEDLFGRIAPVDYSKPRNMAQRINGTNNPSELMTNIEGALRTITSLHEGINANDS
jgi:superfamily II DNA or RNA helicase